MNKQSILKSLSKSKIFNLLILLTIIGEFFVPFVLKHFYEGYDSNVMDMSVLGGQASPTRYIYNAWLIWLGIFLIIVAVVYYFEKKDTSRILAVLQSTSIMTYAVGAGIIAAFFHVNETKDNMTTSMMVHGAGASIGFMFLIFFPLFMGLLAKKNHNKAAFVVGIMSFVLAFVTFVCFIMGDKEEFKDTIIAYEGLWERLSLFCMYIPFLYKSIGILIIK